MVEEKKKRVELDASKPHTLADFVKESLYHGTFPEGLPEGMEPMEAAQLLQERTDIHLRPLPVNDYYFHGWFENEGRRIETVEGIHLFTLVVGDMFKLGGIGFHLQFEDAARELLKGGEKN